VRWSNGSLSLIVGQNHFQLSETDMPDRTVRIATAFAAP